MMDLLAYCSDCFIMCIYLSSNICMRYSFVMVHNQANDNIISLRELLIIQNLKICCGKSLKIIKDDLPCFLKNLYDSSILVDTKMP